MFSILSFRSQITGIILELFVGSLLFRQCALRLRDPECGKSLRQEGQRSNISARTTISKGKHLFFNCLLDFIGVYRCLVRRSFLIFEKKPSFITSRTRVTCPFLTMFTFIGQSSMIIRYTLSAILTNVIFSKVHYEIHRIW